MTKPDAVQKFKLAWLAATGLPSCAALENFETVRAVMTPTQIVRLDPTFRRQAVQAQRPEPGKRWPFQTRVMSKRAVDWQDQFSIAPETALLAMHAPDGRLREKAIAVAPMRDPAAHAVLLLRCNDWAPSVRSAAQKRLAKVLPSLDQDALSALCLFVLDRCLAWSRGGQQAGREVMQHLAWPMALKSALMTQVDGPLARMTRQVLRKPSFDWALPELAMSAKSPFVRSIAVEALLNGQVRWVTGFDWVWHDKVFNLKRKMARWDQRDINVDPQTRHAVIRSACFDPSARVRSLVADELIRSGAPTGDPLVTALRADKAESVQVRMAFFDKKWGSGDAGAQKGIRQ